MFPVKFFLIVVFFCALLLPQNIHSAMKLELVDTPSTITAGKEYYLKTALIDAPKDEIYYLQLALTKKDRNSYFGYTKGKDDIFHHYSENFDNFYQLVLNNESSWSGELGFKFEVEEKNFDGPGEYILKAARFTKTGKSKYWSDNQQTVYIESINNTPTSIKPTVTLISTKIISKVFSTPTAVHPIVSKSAVAILSPTVNIHPTEYKVNKYNILGTNSADLSNDNHIITTSNLNEEIKNKDRYRNLPNNYFVFILFGMLSIVTGIIYSIYLAYRQKNNI